MYIGIPKEIMTGEGRIALVPEACESLIKLGHTVFIENNAGLSSGYTNQDYLNGGVESVGSAAQLYDEAQLIIKVKQPLAQDIRYLREDHLLFCYLHLAADLNLIKTLCHIGLSAIPFEAVTDDHGNLPLLAPMSQIAGRIAVLRGASLLFKNSGGRGVLLGGVEGTDVGRVVVLGAGVAGSQAVAVAVALGAKVDVLDLNENKLTLLKRRYPAIDIHQSTAKRVEKLCLQADLVIGAVLLAGRRAPLVLRQAVVKQMREGSVIVDIAIDQGGCVEGIRATSSEQLCYFEHNVIHSAVPNMPATVARTASQSLSSAIYPYVEALLGSDLSKMEKSSIPVMLALHRGLAVYQGEVVDKILQHEMDSRE